MKARRNVYAHNTAIALAMLVACLWWVRPVDGMQQSLDPLVIDPEHYHLDFENSFVQVVRGRIGPGEKVKMHEHLHPALTVFLTDQHLRTASPGGNFREVRAKAGEVRWYEAGTHMAENLSDKPYEYLRINIKATR